MNPKNKQLIQSLCYAAVCLALALLLPFLTGQVPTFGSMLCPMHLPVLLAGFLCGPWWAAAVGLIAPLLRHLMFGMPPFPVAFAMCFELAAYGLISGLLYTKLPKRPLFVYLSLLGAMLSGRIVWGIAMVIIMNVSGGAFTWQAFFAGGFAQAVPGILVQIVLIPPLVLALRKTGIIRE